MLPHGIISFFFGSIGSNLKPISIYQVIMVFSIIILFVVLYILLIKKSKDEKYNAILLMSLALVLQYFKIYTYSDIKLWNLPIHICNLGTLLIFISVVFKLRGLFLFTYYINVFGATVALMIPLINDDFLSFPTFNFMFEHALVLIIPILSVIIGVNERPKIKEISKIIPLFTGYYLFSIIIGSIFYIYDRNVNYFYVIKDTIANFVVFLKPLRNITFNIGKAVFYPVYYFVIYLGIIALMYIMNFIYLYVYSLEDTRVEIRKVKEREENLLKKRKKEKFIKPKSDLILEVKALTKIYPNGFKALSKVSLSLKKGDILWLLGHNGAGKSTLIKCITKIIEKTEGEVFIGGINIDSLSNETKLMTGYCSDDHCQYEKLTPIEYLDYILNIYQIEGDHKQIITKYLELLNLIYVKDSVIETFSHGMKQKLSIIASIIHEPKLLVLDEPLSGLDIPTLKEIKGFLTNYALQGNSIIYSAHQYDVSDPLCNRVICLDKGKILSNFNVDTVEDLDHLKNEYIKIGYNKGTL
jgi:ABC-2 type transport system ATP-binding protein